MEQIGKFIIELVTVISSVIVNIIAINRKDKEKGEKNNGN